MIIQIDIDDPDATPMVGFTSAMAREKAVPLSIENGCDMFLFNKDLAETESHQGFREARGGISPHGPAEAAAYPLRA